MRYLECPVCHANVDSGELIGGICIDCAEKEERKKDSRHHLKLMLASRDFRQMELEGI